MLLVGNLSVNGTDLFVQMTLCEKSNQAYICDDS